MAYFLFRCSRNKFFILLPGYKKKISDEAYLSYFES